MFGRKEDEANGSPAPPNPPAMTHPPLTECPVCDGTSFTEVKAVALKLAQATGKGAYATEKGFLDVNAVFCDRCGRVEWFALKPSTLQKYFPAGPQ